MLVFILALQSPAASKDWSRVSKLCERTLRSVCAQTSPDFRVFLVCNTRPDTDFTHPNLTIIERDFPIPESTSAARMNDKRGKLKIGLVAARHLAPAHVMFVDADDCVHRGLAEYVEKRPDAAGWSFNIGYIHDEGSRWLFRAAKFFQRCGSSAIIRLSPKDFPASESDPSRELFILSHGHTIIKDGMAKRGTPLHALPFAGATYITNTGENDSGTRMSHWQGNRQILESLLAIRPLTKRMRSNMGLYDLV